MTTIEKALTKRFAIGRWLLAQTLYLPPSVLALFILQFYDTPGYVAILALRGWPVRNVLSNSVNFTLFYIDYWHLRVSSNFLKLF
jgi:hypothetical protein